MLKDAWSWISDKATKVWDWFERTSGKWQAITMITMLVLIVIYAWD